MLVTAYPKEKVFNRHSNEGAEEAGQRRGLLLKGDKSMRLLKTATMIFVFALAAFVLAPGMKAGNDAWNMKTTMVFTQAFEVPGGQVMPAGAYTFRLLDSAFDREFVQITNVEGNKVYAIVHANPIQGAEVNEATKFTMAERPAGAPRAIKVWFNPGVRMGHEFPVASEGVIVTYPGD
jgi:hypothetical protein